MALFRKPRRGRATEASKAPRQSRQPAPSTAPPLLQQLQTIAAEAATPEEALEPALRAIVEGAGAAGGALCLFDQRHSVLRLSAEVGLTDEGCRRLRTIRRGDPSCWDIPLHGVVNRRAYLIENASQNRYVPPLVDKATGMRTIACIPVYSGISALASLVLVSAPPRSFAELDIAMLWKPLRQLASMIDAVRKQVGTPDPNADLGTPAPLDLYALTAERDRLRAQLAGRSAEFERLSLQLAGNREEMGRLYAALEGAVAERGELSRELERVRAESEDTTSLSQALAEAERERQRLAAALETAVRDAEAREAQAIARIRREAESALEAREVEWEATRRAHEAHIASTQQLAEERAAEVARLTSRVSELESGAVAGRGHDTRREGEIARLSAALEAAASRETDLRARLAQREAERVGAADGELAAAREALEVAEAGRARAEERAASLDAELQTLRQALESAHAELAQAREEIAAIRESERAAVVEGERRQAALETAERLETELRSRADAAERLVGEMSAERDRATEEARTHQNAAARAEAKVEALSAERDRLREALARAEAEVARLRTALESAQTEDARVEGILARERAEQAELGERVAEAEAAVARLEAITVEQRSELAHREAEIVRLSAEHAQLLAERERLLAERTMAEAALAIESPALPVESSDLEAAALVSPDAPATVVRSDAGVTVINVEAATPEQPFVPTGAPIVVVLDGDQGWRSIGLEGHDVAVVKPGATSVQAIQELAPARIVANLAAPGALTALLALRGGGFGDRLWACVANVASDTAIALGAVEPVVGPIDPDAIIGALGSYAGRDGRIVTAGADVDALMSLRQALSRRRASVSMAWDAKQAREMLGVVRPHAVVVDLGMPKRDGCAIVAATASLDPVPLLVLVTSANGDAALDFAAVLSDPPRETIVQRATEVFQKVAHTDGATLPELSQKPVQKLQVGQGPRWVG